jgi:type IV pilus assembly protein PilA
MKLTRRPLEPRTLNLEPGEAGFTLIELLIVLSIMLIIMAFAIPNVLKMKKNANQQSAVQSMHVIASAELSYAGAYPSNGYGCPIAVLGGDSKSGAPSPQAAQLIDPNLASTGIKAGYVFSITCGSKTTANNQDVYGSFELTGVPQSIGHSGDNGYCTDESNIVKVDPAGGTNCTQPLQ